MMLLWLPAAWAAPVHRGVQAEVFPGGLRFAADRLEAEPLEIGPFDLQTSIDCYHTLDVRDFALTVPFASIDVALGQGTIEVDVQLGEVLGEDIGIQGVSDWFDLCIDFDTTVEYVRIRDGRLRGTLRVATEGDRPALAFASPPVLTGEFDSQIDWFPDDLAWALFGDVVLDTAADLLADRLPGLLEAPIDAVVPTAFGDIPASISVSEVGAAPSGVSAAADVDLGADGAPDGPTLALGERDGSHFAVGVTEDLVQEVLDVARADGILAAGATSTEALIADLQATAGLGSVTPVLDIDGQPSVVVGPDGLRLALPGVTLEAVADGERLLFLAVDLEARLELAVDAEQAMIVLSTHDVAIDVREIDVSRLVRDAEGAAHLEDFLEGWVADAVGVMVQRVPVFSSQFPVLDLVIRLDAIGFEDDGVGAWFTLFDLDDPAVDLVPPDSNVAVAVSGGAAVATLGGVDDRAGALTFSYRVDGLTWSAWQAEDRVTLANLAPGAHTIEVRARDGWQNPDPTPATTTFAFEIPADAEPRGCGCDGTSAAPWGWLAGLALALSSRRSRPRGSGTST
jgi:hypothetical protein